MDLENSTARMAPALEAGFAVGQLGHAANEATLISRAFRLFCGWASPLAHDASGTLAHRVEDHGARATPRTYYSHGCGGGDIHTDGTYIHQTPPELVALLCVRPAERGGESILIDGARVLERLSSRARDALFRPHHFDTDGQVPGQTTLVRPVVTASHRIHYLRKYIEAGHRVAGVPLDSASLQAMDEVDRLIQSPDLQLRLRLRAGALLSIDNRRFLHGRTAFEDDCGAAGRLLVRFWGRCPC